MENELDNELTMTAKEIAREFFETHRSDDIVYALTNRSYYHCLGDDDVWGELHGIIFKALNAAR
jgi:hypothetical protein